MKTDQFFIRILTNILTILVFCSQVEEKTHGFNKNKAQFVENSLNFKAWVISSFILRASLHRYKMKAHSEVPYLQN